MADTISKRTLQRLPLYLALLQDKEREGVEYISATTIANILNLNHVQVRKDLSCASNAGKPKVGYETTVLISDLQNFLDYNNTKHTVIIGAGGLGGALLGYSGFANYGLNVNAGFDTNPELIGTDVNGKHIYSIEDFPDYAKENNIHIAIITTPASVAQSVCNMLVENGIIGIWNFAPVSLNVPKGVIVQNENMATSLAVLSNRLGINK